MKVLLISSNTLPAAPSGPAYVAGAVRQAGHMVEVFECLFSAGSESSLPPALAAQLERFRPDVIGLSIRLVHGDLQDSEAPFGTRYVDLRPRVKALVEGLRQASPALIVLGGPGFNYYARDWLEYLDLQYGIRGEGEESFPRFLALLAAGEDVASVPGCVVHTAGQICGSDPLPVENLNCQALPAYDLFDWPSYTHMNILPAILTKRGCAFDCTFCPYSRLEGRRYRLKTPERVLAEVEHTLRHTTARRVMFCDNSFNIPLRHASALCHAFQDSRLDFQWGTGDLKPIGVSDDFCRLMLDSGCFYACLSIESASAGMLRAMKRGYTTRQVRQSLEALARSGLPYSASLLFGAPGETPETIAETLAVLQEYPIPLGVWVTIGIYLWTDYQPLVGELRQSGGGNGLPNLFDGPVYRSPDLSLPYLHDLLADLRARPGYTVQVNRSDRLPFNVQPVNMETSS